MANVLNSNELRPGMVYEDGGESLQVLDYMHRKYGRGQATIRVKVKNLGTGAIAERTYDSGVKLPEVDTYRRSGQYLYQDGLNAVFMDVENYQQFNFSLSELVQQLKFLKEGEKVVVLYLNDSPVSVEMPASVELVVTSAPPAVSGDTVSNATKKAVLETGTEIDVPMFVQSGDKIKVNTETSSYAGRV
jgi:elongation factor P